MYIFKNQLTKTFVWLTAFSIAMGFMETAVVIYLRELYYPEGFNFPLTPIAPNIALTEFLREAATIIMLAGIGILTGKNKMQRFAFFIYAFAIWDIFYYVFLKLLIDWPVSLLTWDILFIIPIPWVGPVLAPIIISLTMIGLSIGIIYFQEKGCITYMRIREQLAFYSGSFIVIISFIWDYLKSFYQTNTNEKIWTLLSEEALFKDMVQYIPGEYNWWLFLLGEGLILYGIRSFICYQKNFLKLN